MYTIIVTDKEEILFLYNKRESTLYRFSFVFGYFKLLDETDSLFSYIKTSLNSKSSYT